MIHSKSCDSLEQSGIDVGIWLCWMRLSASMRRDLVPSLRVQSVLTTVRDWSKRGGLKLAQTCADVGEWSQYVRIRAFNPREFLANILEELIETDS